jgi:hypothetical protein
MIDPESVRQEVMRRLPIHARLVIEGDSLDFDFSRSRAPLLTIAATDVNDFTIIEIGWSALYLFGEQDFCDGGGAHPYLGVNLDSGEICGLDIEREKSHVFLLNTNLDRFIRTFQKIDEILRCVPVARGRLSEALTEIDPEAFQRSEWQNFSRYVEAGT